MTDTTVPMSDDEKARYNPLDYPKDYKGRSTAPYPAKGERGTYTYRKDGKVDPGLTERLCEWLAEGNYMGDFCKIPGNPTRRAVYGWRKEDPEFDRKVTEAQEIGYDVMAENIHEVAVTPGTTQTEIVEHAVGKWPERRKTITEDNVQQRKLAAEFGMKMLSVWHPKKFGQKAQIEHSGNVELADQMRAAQARLEARRAALLPASPADPMQKVLAAAEQVSGELLQLPLAEPPPEE